MSNLLQHKKIGLQKSTRGVHELRDGADPRHDYTLVDRCQQYKHITKSLLHYYQGLAQIQKDTSKHTLALCDTIQVPFHEGHQFLGNGGWQEVLYAVRDKTKLLGEHHSNYANTIETTVVKELEGVRQELKAHISAIEKEAGSIADDLDKERAKSTEILTQLQNGIDTFDNSSTHMLPQHDPYLVHIAAQKQLEKQVHKENDLQSALIRFQQQQPAFEESIVKSIQSACKLFDEAHATKIKEFDAIHQEISQALQTVSPTAEYEFAASKEGFVIDPNTASRDVKHIVFPGLNHASSKAIKEGYLERKKRFTKSYKESYYILTPSGYLHEKRTNDLADTNAPGFSLFLPECALGPPAKESDKSHKFHVEGNKAVKSSFESRVKNTLRFGGKEIAYTFRARTHADLLAWWEILDKVSKESKSTNEPRVVEPTDPIKVAVVNVGRPQAKDEVAAAEQAAAKERGETTADGETTTATTTTADGAVVAPLTSDVSSTAPLPPPVAATDEDDDELSGGSSAEEEDEEARQARTAPTTPAVNGNTTSPLDKETDALPGYQGNPHNISTAEKQAMTEKGPILPVNETDNVPKASTSTST
ncbi:hypothetical protein OIO90_002310 [Microbotryomycetes sp. JL221]|nr:hypothetical protein OIO90_002310 [Microbotryomycetes sp. JL221]